MKKINITSIKEARKATNPKRFRSAWDKGVCLYALELLDNLEEAVRGGYVQKGTYLNDTIEGFLLNGASDWSEFSWGGCSLIYGGDIAERLCTPSELKRTDHGNRKPNSNEEWLDTQARALSQASKRVCRCLTSY